MTYWDGYRWLADEPRQEPPRRPAGRRLLGAGAEAVLITLLVFGLIAGTALAKGGSKPVRGGTIDSLEFVTDANADGLPNHLDEITFTVTTSATDMPMVGLRCWQGSTFVHDGYIALYDASWLVKYFRLDSAYWDPAQAATCTARLFYYDNRSRERVLATLDLTVAP